MTNITGVKVRFSRTRQAAQFEPAQAEVELSASIDEGNADANPNAAAQTAAALLAQAKAAVFVTLGLAPAQPPVAETTEAPRVPTTRGRKPKATDAPPTTSAPVATTTIAPSTTAAPASAGASTQTPADPEPWEVEQPAPAQSAAAKPVTDNDLQALASKFAQAGKGPRVKALMAEFGVKRLGELTQPQRVEFVKKLEAE